MRLSLFLLAALMVFSTVGCVLYTHRGHHGKTKVMWVPGVGVAKVHHHRAPAGCHNHGPNCGCHR